MKAFALPPLLAVAVVFLILPVRAATSPHEWVVTSPTHEQTFSFGTERRHQWDVRDGSLVLYLSFTNDPYVQNGDPRLYDDFTFRFPQVHLGADGRTFYYTAPNGKSVAVAAKQPDGLGIDHVELLPSSDLLVESPHGWLTLKLIVGDQPIVGRDDN